MLARHLNSAHSSPTTTPSVPRIGITEHGLLDKPQKRPAGKGHGSAPALYPVNQRNLLLTLLHHRPGNSIRSLARIPVAIWMYWGEEWVPLRQARRALMRYLGDPASKTYTPAARRATKDRARAVAQAILGHLDNPAAIPQARAANCSPP